MREFYFYTYSENDSVRTQQKRVLGYSTKETIIIDSLAKSQLYSRYGDGTHCAIHSWKWSMEQAKIRNFINEYQRQKAIEEVNKKEGKICIICELSHGQLYNTTSGEFVHSECNYNTTVQQKRCGEIIMIEIDEITLAYLQINNIEHMACDFPTFHKAVEKVLGREVWTHQFMRKQILEERRLYFKHREDKHQNLCFEDIRNLINQKFKEFCEMKQNTSQQTFRGVSKE